MELFDFFLFSFFFRFVLYGSCVKMELKLLRKLIFCSLRFIKTAYAFNALSRIFHTFIKHASRNLIGKYGRQHYMIL